jgi:signal transduction histidine kinase
VSSGPGARWQLAPAAAALLAHELGNPLGIGRLCAQDLAADLGAFHGLLLQLGGEDLDPQLQALFAERFAAFEERLDTLAATQQRIAGLVEELRAQGQGAHSPAQALDLAERLRAALQLAAARAPGALDWRLEGLSALPWRGPQAVLDRVLLNLALNAVQAIERRAREAPEGYRGRLRGRCSVQSGRLIVEIDDNGAGIEAADLARVFEPGFSRRGAEGGSGIGLAYCREALRALDGDISVASLPGQGTRFRLWLPEAPSPAGESVS